MPLLGPWRFMAYAQTYIMDFLRPEAVEGIKCGAVEPLPDMPKEDGLEVSK